MIYSQTPALYPDVSLSMKMCVQRKADGDNGWDVASPAVCTLPLVPCKKFNLSLDFKPNIYTYSIICFSCGEMKKYLDEAEEDKKRYIEELKIYQQSEQYQAFMKRQSAKKVKTIVGKIL